MDARVRDRAAPDQGAAHPVLPWLAAAGPPPGPASGTSSPGPRRSRSRPAAFRFAPGRGVALLVVGALVVAAAAVGTVVLQRSGARTATTPFLSYTVPEGWSPTEPDVAAARATPVLSGAAQGPGYDCGGEHHVRGFAAAALLPVEAPDAGPADRAERLARWFAASAWSPPGGTAPEVTVAPPRPVRVAGPDGPVDGTVTEAAVRSGGGAGCPAGGGVVLVLAAPVSGGAALVLVGGDTDGGPAEPAPPERATLEAVLASVRLTAR